MEVLRGLSHELLEEEELRDLIEKSQAGDKEALNKIVESNLRLITLVIYRRWKHKRELYEDMFQIGSIGLIKAVNHFDLSLTTKFSSYAITKIEGEIIRFFRDKEKSIRLPRALWETVPKITKRGLEKGTPEEVSKILGIPENVAADALEAIANWGTYSLDQRIEVSDSKNKVTMKDQIEGDLNGRFWLDKIALREAIETLSDRDKSIIQKRFFEDKSQTQVSKELGVSQNHVSRLERKIIKKLREELLGEDVA